MKGPDICSVYVQYQFPDPAVGLSMVNKILAYHEAGHAVIGALLGYKIKRIDFGKAPYEGLITWKAVPGRNMARLLHDQASLYMTLAGFASESIFLARSIKPYTVPGPRVIMCDFVEAQKLLSNVIGSNLTSHAQYFTGAFRQVKTLIKKPAVTLAIKDLARVSEQRALFCEHVKGTEAHRIIANAFASVESEKGEDEQERRRKYLQQLMRY